MSTFDQIGMIAMRPQTAFRPMTRRAGISAFSVPATGTQGPAAAPIAGLSDLLALQEAGQAAVRDREARRHGAATLKALASMQRALLGGEANDVLETLSSLSRNAPEASDPRLAAVQRALQVRVAVELARGRAERLT